MSNQNIVSQGQDRSTGRRFAKRQDVALSTPKVLPMSQTTIRIGHRFEVGRRVPPGVMKSRTVLKMFANEFVGLAEGEERDFSEQGSEYELDDHNREDGCKGDLPAVETERIRVLYVYENPVCIEGIRAILEAQPDMQLLASAAGIEDGIRQYLEHKPDVMLMDDGLPAVNGFDALGAVRDKFPDARLIIHTRKSGDVHASRALKAGAFGYIPARTLSRDLVDAIRAVHRGQKYIPAEIAETLAQYVLDDMLTPREIEILGHIATGSTNKIIAGRLGITEDTVKAHMKSILSKLSANDRAHAVVIAIRRGFIDL